MSLLLGIALLCACGESDVGRPGAEHEAGIDLRLGLSQDSKRDVFETLRAERAAPRHPSDGGGRAWIESVEDAGGAPVRPRAGDRARIRITYEAGPLGIARNGVLVFRVSPWWEWDRPQPLDRLAAGYTEVSVPGDTPRPQLSWDGESLHLAFTERALASGERVHLIYGAGPALARVDRYAERGERFWLAVDGDGDGIRQPIADPPTIDIAAGTPTAVRLVLPSTASPGDEVIVRLSVLDVSGNAASEFTGELRLSSSDGLELPETLGFAPKHRGSRRVIARVRSPGVYRVKAAEKSRTPHEALGGVSNPMLVEPDAARLYWADLHGHSQLSDGTGTPEDYFRHARDVAGLDAIALTDHDHWGLQFLDEHPTQWERIRTTVARFHEPGRFVTLLGYEWTSLLHGHRHVLYFENSGEVHSAFDDRYQTPTQLWAALRGQSALTFAHHSAGGPISTNWRYRPDPELEPVTEIVSLHGSSEAPDSPKPIYAPASGNFVRDALDDGLRFGFIGGGDSHDGHPGATHLDSERGGGLAAIFAEALSRNGILEAMRKRRVYATNGARIILEVSLDGAPMGSAIEASASATTLQTSLRIRAVAETPLARVDLVRSGHVDPIPLSGELEWSVERPIAPLRRGEYLYVRVVQRDGGAAWSSPIYTQ